jgi:hypothetical protein
MAFTDALLTLAVMGTLLPILISPFLLTPISVGALVSGTFVIAQGAGHAVLVRWLRALTALFLVALIGAAAALVAASL